MRQQKPKRVLAYARVSSTQQDERGTSLEAQQEEFDRYCATSGYPKPRVYIEVEGGGQEKLEKRLELHRLLADVRDGDLVLCSKQDRWSRYTLFYLQSVEQIISRGARFFSIAERFDPSTPEGKFAAATMANVAELEHARIRDRTVGARRRLRAMGKFVEGAVPFGYRAERTERTIAIDDAKAAIVRRMFAMCIAGKSTREISAALENSYPDVGGLDPAAIARKLRNRVYLGEMRPTAKKGVAAKPGDQWIESHPPIVDRATWRQAQETLSRRRCLGRPGSDESRTADFLLRGIVRCGHCGYVMRSHSPTPGGSVTHGGYYMCRRQDGNENRCERGPLVRHAELDAAVDKLALAHLEASAAELAKPKRVPPPPKMDEYDKRKETLLKMRRTVMGKVASGVVSDEEARETLDEIRTGIEDVERERAVQEDHPAQTATDRRAVLASVVQVRAAWGSLTTAEKRAKIARLASRLSVYSTARAKWQRTGTWRLEAEWKAI
jgi:site-specific DNA recombinase